MAVALERIPYFSVLWTLCCIYVVFKIVRFGSREKHLPPGPRTYPIVGNAHLAIDKQLYKKKVFSHS